MWIENVAAGDVSTGFHHDAGENSMLIQISDPGGWFPTPKHIFKEIHQFEFLDAEDSDGFADSDKISDDQAQSIVGLLLHAKAKRMNVVVHCMAGICRSGAVVDVGVQMGFSDCEKFRSPNLRVKHKLMRVLGWTYDANEKPNLDDWRSYKPNF